MINRDIIKRRMEEGYNDHSYKKSYSWLVSLKGTGEKKVYSWT